MPSVKECSFTRICIKLELLNTKIFSVANFRTFRYKDQNIYWYNLKQKIRKFKYVF